MNQKNNLIIGVIIAIVVVMSYDVGVDPIAFVEGLPNLGIVLKELGDYPKAIKCYKLFGLISE